MTEVTQLQSLLSGSERIVMAGVVSTPINNLSRRLKAGFAVLGLVLGCSVTALADDFTVTYLPPGVQTPAGVTTNYETFNGLTYNGTSLTTNFNGGGMTGTYTGSVALLRADQYGGAGGAGTYIAAAGGSSYALAVGSPANYFGLWFSALDPGNTMSFYNGSSLLYTFTPAAFIQLVGACTGSSLFCGNPNAAFLNANSGQQYAYLNFYDTDGSFNRIVFSEAPGGNFESDNHAIADLASGTGPIGTVISGPSGVTPEPSTFTLLGTAAVAGVTALRRRLS